MIKKIATIMALTLGMSMIGMVPASAATSCTFGSHSLTVEIADGGTASIGVNGDEIFCDDDNNPFDGDSGDTDEIDELTVEMDTVSDEDADFTIYLADDNDNDAVDYSFLSDVDIEINGTLNFDGDSVEDGDLEVEVGSSSIAFNGAEGSYDDDELELVTFDDGEESDTVFGLSASVEFDVTVDSGGYDVITTGSEDDTISVDNNRRTVVYGNGGNDDITDSGDDETCDVFYGGSGNDNIEMAGDDCDKAYPGTGNDDLKDVALVSYNDLSGSVTIEENGEDTETGGLAGDDEFDGAPEAFYGTRYADTLIGGVDGDAVLFALGGNDFVRSFNSNKVYGGMGNDTLIGSDLAVNYLYGGAGNDRLRGFGAGDYLFGGNGSDIVNGGRGTDICDGETLLYCEFVK